jgi:integral membrane protein (TIGR01906 family)
MSKSNVLVCFVSSVVVLLWAFVLLLTCIELSAFDLRFYSAEYRKLNRPEAIGVSEQELMDVTRALLDYIKGEREDLHVKAVIKGQERYVFNEREIAHMVDVRELFMQGYKLRTVLIVGLILALAALYMLARADYIGWLFKAYLSLLIFLVLAFGTLFVLINADFTPYWDYFHYIFFDNDLWQLNPDTDILIQMVPEEFFYDIVVRIITHFILGILAVGVLLGGMYAWLKRLKWNQG